MKQASVTFLDSPRKRYAFLALVLVGATLVSTDGWAQVGTASAALEKASTDIGGMWKTLKTIILIVMGIMGMIGAASCYSKWSNGDPDTRKAVASWVGALIFAGVVVAMLESVFNLR